MRKHPVIHHYYLYLMDNLIADGRVEEAEKVLSQYEQVEGHRPYLVPDYAAKILKAKGDYTAANQKWNEEVEQFQDQPIAWFCRAEAYVRECTYDQAITCYEKAFETQTAPRMYDALWAIATIYEIQGAYAKAAATWDQIAEVIHDEWKIEVGEELAFPKREAARLRAAIR